MGFKKTSDLIAVSFGVAETVANTYVQDEIALQLDVLNNEIFVVLAVDLNCSPPDALAGQDTNVQGALSSTSQTAMSFLSNTNTIATTERTIRAAGYADGGVGFSHFSGETPTGDVDYVALIATNNFFVSVKGTNNGTLKSMAGRLWGYRARADANTFSALVQSELLSA